jgi:hypothetical protein
MATAPIIFRHQEPEVVRVPKFNRLSIMAAAAYDGTGGGGGGGDSDLIIDGGDATNTVPAYIFIDGGEA